jgi:hypothetical protein
MIFLDQWLFFNYSCTVFKISLGYRDAHFIALHFTGNYFQNTIGHKAVWLTSPLPLYQPP